MQKLFSHNVAKFCTAWHLAHGGQVPKKSGKCWHLCGWGLSTSLVSEPSGRMNCPQATVGLIIGWRPPKNSPNTWFIKEFENIIHHQNLEMTGVCNKWSGTIRACIWNQWQSSSCSSCKWEFCWVHIAIGTVPGREKYKSCLISGLTMVYGRYNELVFMGVIMVYKSQKTDLQITKEIRVKRHPWSWTQSRAVGNCCFMLRHDWMHVALLRYLI